MNTSVLIFVVLASLAVSPAFAETYQLDGVDITPAVEFYRPQVKTLIKPVVVFNWSPNGGVGNKNLNPEESLAFAKSGARVFWDNFGAETGGNTFGMGLYFAQDPVITRRFGGGDDNWALLELKFPTGFKILEAGEDTEISATPQISSILEKFDCLKLLKPTELLSSAQNKKALCRQLTRTIFDEILKVDAFAYRYSAATLNGCTYAPEELKRAFVLTRPENLNAGSAQYFTQQMTGLKQDRLLLQSILLLDINSMAAGHRKYSRITNAESMAVSFYPLLWADLEGDNKSAFAQNFLIKNTFGCSGISPYEKATQP